MRDTKKAVWLNAAAAHLKRGEHKQAASMCSKVLEIEGTNIKALYRRAQSNLATKYFVEAEVDIKMARALDPKDVDLIKLQRRLIEERRKDDKKSSQLYGNMFKNVTPISELEAKKASEKAKV